MQKDEKTRIDKWLWAIRAYKTRTQATDACNRGRIIISGRPVKASREVKAGDIVMVRKMPVIYTYKVINPISKRVSASLAAECFEDLTSLEELEKLNINETIFIKRDKGSGRPTKKERRILDKLNHKNKE